MGVYGAAGHFGVGVPQSNPTVEPEIGLLLPRAACLSATRLTSSEPNPLDRLRAYIDDLDTYLERFDAMKLDAFGFACTGSSYLLGAAREQEITERCEEKFGYPVLAAADSIVWMLNRLGVSKVAMLAPYPTALIDAGCAYLQSRGIDAVAVHRVVTSSADTRSIYQVTDAQAREGLAQLSVEGAQAVLISGTGMASLSMVDATAPLPVVSSNFCLAVRMLAASERIEALDRNGCEPLGWRARLTEALGGGAI
jgi:maleate isomerase